MTAIGVVAAAHVGPVAAIQAVSDSIGQLYAESGFDRAADLLAQGDLAGVLALNAVTATYSGAALAVANDIIACLEGDENAGIDITGLNDLKELQQFFFNLKRSESFLSTTLNKFRDDARAQIREVEMPILREIRGTCDRVIGQLANSRCAGLL